MNLYLKSGVVLTLLLAMAIVKAENIKFGTVSLSDLEMTVYEPDSTASAVILSEIGYFDANRYMTFIHKRIKILSNEGFSYADQKIRNCKKSDIRGYTFNLANGKIEKTKLESTKIFEVRAYNDRYDCNFAMPNVKVGSIIDLEIQFVGMPESWFFQYSIPVSYSELEIEPSQYITYTKNFFGYTKVNWINKNKWTATDVPAFRAEPDISTTENFRTHVEFNITDIAIPGIYYLSINRDWNSLRKFLYDKTSFGRNLESTPGFIKDMATEITSHASSDAEKLNMAFDRIHIIKWNKIHSLYSSATSLNEVYKDKSGSSGDINIALILLLRRLGFVAEPIVLSTRDNGFLPYSQPAENKLNHVIAYAVVNGEPLYLDATDDTLPYNLLPRKNFNVHGQLMAKDSLGWIELKPAKKEKYTTINNIEVLENGNYKASVTQRAQDYAAADYRQQFHSFNSEEAYKEEYAKQLGNVQISEYSITDADSLAKPVNETIVFTSAEPMTQVGDEYYINPLLWKQVKSNPYTIPNREYPVEFGALREQMVVATIRIPENMEIVSIPENSSMMTPDRSVGFIYNVSKNDVSIMFTYKFNVNSTTILPENYPNFRELFNQIVKKHAESIVLRKKV